jgi:peptidoglycan hydrolase CwlO-like protein
MPPKVALQNELDDLLAKVSKLEEQTVRVEALEKLVREKDGKIKALETQIKEKINLS